MARLMGVDLPRDKRMEIALTYIYGIGRTRSQEILAATGIDRDLRTKDLTDDQVTQLRDYIEGNLKVEGDLRREVVPLPLGLAVALVRLLGLALVDLDVELRAARLQRGLLVLHAQVLQRAVLRRKDETAAVIGHRRNGLAVIGNEMIRVQEIGLARLDYFVGNLKAR